MKRNVILKTTTPQWLRDCLFLGEEGPHCEFVMMTPDVAGILLAHNSANRPIQEQRVTTYRTDMRAGNWFLNGETIIISADGKLNDGQHRLTALMREGLCLPMTVIFGVDRASRYTVDSGMARTTGAQLHMQGEKNAALVAGAARIILLYENGDGSTLAQNYTVTSTMVQTRAITDTSIQDLASKLSSNRNLAGVVSPSIIVACTYLFAQVDAERSSLFIDQVCNGENIAKGDPAFAVRAALFSPSSRRGRTRLEQIELLMRGWCAFLNGDRLLLAKCMGSFPPLPKKPAANAQ